MLASTILASVFVSFVALSGLVFLSFNKQFLKKTLSLLVALAAGSLMGQVFFHLLPEAIALFPVRRVFSLTALSFTIFFLLEKLFFSHHCHDIDCRRPFGYLNLIGDGLHNFLDGVIIAGSFWESSALGWTTTLAIILHEIPQEIGDFAVLIFAGFGTKKALLANFATALLAVLGGIFGYLAISYLTGLEAIILPFAAGGFLYLASVDLLPEINHQKNGHWSSIIFFLAGLGMMFFI
ncbi:MAG: ZIP family metal transporter [Candidatus Shapirobacteria bacterium]|nr:ZIP family metal transporter [Candidatus Shapirobacteria bacterium]MDD5073589.1 ZIP family metal transporter [Candidatus Shapirobacteria bacterium]MDD5481342.1 ZIP family metal transporter [Candidatus Shapirobacteria bacterium]